MKTKLDVFFLRRLQPRVGARPAGGVAPRLDPVSTEGRLIAIQLSDNG